MMRKKRRRRKISWTPDKKTGTSASKDSINITLDEIESVRLKDLLGLAQIEASEKMGISQPTFHRLLISARKKIALALVNGLDIEYKGGEVELVKDKNIEKECICTVCGKHYPHIQGIPCRTRKCNICNKNLMRLV